MGDSVKRYVLRKKPPGKLLQSAHAVDREFQVLSLSQLCDKQPKTKLKYIKGCNFVIS